MQEVTDPNLLARLNGGSQQGRVIKAPNPHQQRKLANEAAASDHAPGKAATEARIAGLEAQIKATEAATVGAQNAAELEKLRLQNEGLRLQLQVEQAKLAELAPKPVQQARDAIQTVIDRIDSIERDVTDNKAIPGFGETGKSGQLSRDWLGDGYAGSDLEKKLGTVTSDFALKALADLPSPLTPISNYEIQLLQSTVANLDPNLSQGEFLAQLAEARRVYQQTLDRLPKAQEAPASEAPAPDKLTPSDGKTKTEIDPVLKAVSARVGRMVADRVPDDKIREYVQRSGVNPQDTNLDAVLQYRASNPDFEKWKRANPGKAYPIGPSFYTKEIPLSGINAVGNAIAQTPGGAFAASMGNAATGNQMANLAGFLGGNEEQVRNSLELLRTQSPLASMAGDIAGGATSEMLLGRIPGLRGGRFGPFKRDFTYGGLYGTGEENGSFLSGATANAAGGAAFRGAARGAGAVHRGIQDPNLRYLHGQGVPLTIGDMGRAAGRNGSQIGDMVARTEDRLAGLPVTESIINSARGRFDEGFNQAAFRQAQAARPDLPFRGNIGSQGVQDLADVRGQAYSFLDPVSLPIDAQLAGRNAGVRAAIPGMPAQGNVVAANLDQLDRSFNPAGQMPGREWQDAIRNVRVDRSGIAGQPGARQATGALDEVENNLMDFAGRQGPPGAALNLQRANNIYMNEQTLLNALDNGPAQAGEMFSPVRLDNAARATRRNFGGRGQSIAGDRPFYDLTTAGKAVRTNMTPDSGTAGRAMFAATLGGALLGGGAGAGVGAATEGQEGAVEKGGSGAMIGAMAIPALLGGVYSRGAQRRIADVMLGDRLPPIQIAEELIANNPWLARIFNSRNAGRVGSGIARDYYIAPELPE